MAPSSGEVAGAHAHSFRVTLGGLGAVEIAVATLHCARGVPKRWRGRGEFMVSFRFGYRCEFVGKYVKRWE